jgi:hypothetical protein
MHAPKRRPGAGKSPGPKMEEQNEPLPNIPSLRSPQTLRAELVGDDQATALGRTVRAYAPMLTLARQLIRDGLSLDQILEVYRGPVLCFRVRLATAARLEVRDGNSGRPVFVPWRERIARTAPPIVQNGPALPGLPPDENNAPSETAAPVAEVASWPRAPPVRSPFEFDAFKPVSLCSKGNQHA